MSKIDILIVEDNPIDARSLKHDLTRMGYNVCGVAENGTSALSQFYSKEPDIILMDIHLKGQIDGIEIAKRICNDELCKKPIIYITVDNTLETFERAKLTRPFAYLLKPYNEYIIQRQIELAIHCFYNKGSEYTDQTTNKGLFLQEFFYIKKLKKMIKVYYKDIFFAKVESNYSTIITENEKFTLVSSLKELDKKLPAENFIRIHKNYIANLQKVQEFDFDEYTAKLPGHTLPIGKKFKRKISEKLPQLF